MPDQFDIVLEFPRRVLIVECGGPSFTPEEAAYARNSMSEAYNLDAPYFMFALPDNLYLWKKDTASDALPDFSAPAARVWRDYLGDLCDQPDGPERWSMEYAMAAWLGDLASGIRQPAVDSDADQMLVRAGVYEQIKDATVRTADET